MKFKRTQKIDYQSSLFIGVIMLFVAVGGMIARPNDLVMNAMNALGTIIIFGQAYFRYKRKQNLFKEPLI